MWVRELFAGNMKLIVNLFRCDMVIQGVYMGPVAAVFLIAILHTIELTPIACYIDVFRPVGTPYRHDEGVHTIHVESCMN